MPNTISYNLQRLQTARSDIAAAITAKGGIVGSNDGFEEFVNDINSIPTGGGSSFVLDNVKCKPSLKGELKDFPVWINTNITSENGSSGYTSISLSNANFIWTDGEDYYYSYDSILKIKYNESLNMWIAQPGTRWSFSMTGTFVWTDDENIYYTRYYSGSTDDKYVLDKTTNSWVSKTWNFSGASQPSSWYGSDIWKYESDIYLSTSNGSSFILDKSTSTWVTKTWNKTIKDGSYIWTDGENYYYSYQNSQYVLNKTTMQWGDKQWSYSFDYRAFYGNYIWTDGEKIYYWASSSTAYVLDVNTSTWNPFSTSLSIIGTSVWTDGDFIYSDYYAYNKTTKRVYSLKDANSWGTSISGTNVWTDGEGIYFGASSLTSTIDSKVKQLVINKNETPITGISIPNNIPFV